MKKLKEKYNKMNPREQKMFLIRVISGACFLLAGLIFGIVALAMFHWSFIEFIKNPTVDLIFLCLIGIGIFMFAPMEVK